MRILSHRIIVLTTVLIVLTLCVPAADLVTQPETHGMNTHDATFIPSDDRGPMDYIQTFEGSWPPSGWSEVSYYGQADWYRSSSAPLPNVDPPSYYAARIEGHELYTASGILQSTTYDSTGARFVRVWGYFRDVGIDTGDVKVYFKDSSGNWDNMADLNLIRGTYNWGNNWYDWSIETFDSQYKHSNFAFRFYARNIRQGEIAGLDNVHVRTQFKYYAGANADTELFAAYSVETTLRTPSQAPTREGDTCSALLSVFDSAYSYDQLGFQSHKYQGNMVWRVYAGWTTNPGAFVYHQDTSSPVLSLNTEYRFLMSVGYGYVGYSIYQGDTRIYSFTQYTGGSYFRIEDGNQYSAYGFTVYEEVDYYFADDMYIPEPNFKFRYTKVDTNYWEDWLVIDPGSQASVYIWTHTVYVYNF